MINSRLSALFSDFCLDISKAYFIGAYVASPSIDTEVIAYIIILLKGILNASIFLYFSYIFTNRLDHGK